MKLGAENWFLDRMWDSDFCVGIMCMKNNMDLSFVVLVWTMVCYDERRFVIPFTETRAGGLLRMLTYSVSRYWCNGIQGFHMEQWGCFWWMFVSCIIRRCPLFYCTPTSSFVPHLFGTTSYTCTISVFYISSTHFEPVPAQPKTRGIGDIFVQINEQSTSSRNREERAALQHEHDQYRARVLHVRALISHFIYHLCNAR